MKGKSSIIVTVIIFAILGCVFFSISGLELLSKQAEEHGEGSTEFPTEEDIENWLKTMREFNMGAGTTPVDVSNERVKIFIFFGQSNMVGQGLYAEFPEDMRSESEYRLRLEDGGWVMQKPFDPRGHNGPEISFLYYLSEAFPGERFGVIKVAKGGTGIRAFSPEWSFEEANITGDGEKGPLYRLIKEKIELAKATCIPEFAGVIMKQGGKDMEVEGASTGYIDQVKLVIEALRDDTGVYDLPFFVGTYFSAEEMDRWGRARDEGMHDWITRNIPSPIRLRPYSFEVLDQLANADKEIDDTYVIAHGWLPTGPDHLHFNTESQIKYGRMNAETYFELIGHPSA